MRISKRELKRIIRKSLKESMPRMSGIMAPESQEVMDDIARQRNQSDEERVAEIYSQEISDLAMIIHYEGPSSQDEAFAILGEDPRIEFLDQITPEERLIMWTMALEQTEEL